MGNKETKLGNRGLIEKEISIIQLNTGFSRAEVLEWHNQFLSEYKDGFIDKKAFIEIYKKIYTEGNPQKFAEFAFKAFDTDKNGEISFPEFILATSFMIKKGSADEVQKARLEFIFDIFDVNKDSKVNVKELTLLFGALDMLDGQKDFKAKSKANEIIKKYDLDQSKALSKNEFIAALLQEKIFDMFN